jgi:DNA-directed RNA polymerase specialized sigma24 family protein
MAHPGDLIRAAQDDPDAAVAGRPRDDGEADAGHAVTALYRGHALGLTRLAFIMLGDRQAAEDVVQEAFVGLYRAWDRLPDHGNVGGYLRVSVLNGCRSALRRSRRVAGPGDRPRPGGVASRSRRWSGPISPASGSSSSSPATSSTSWGS